MAASLGRLPCILHTASSFSDSPSGIAVETARDTLVPPQAKHNALILSDKHVATTTTSNCPPAMSSQLNTHHFDKHR